MVEKGFCFSFYKEMRRCKSNCFPYLFETFPLNCYVSNSALSLFYIILLKVPAAAVDSKLSANKRSSSKVRNLRNYDWLQSVSIVVLLLAQKRGAADILRAFTFSSMNIFFGLSMKFLEY